jgi:FtsP/CotA-like multicopper oxidase with cupredoxin domain
MRTRTAAGLTRRALLGGGLAATGLAALPPRFAQAAAGPAILKAAPAEQTIVPGGRTPVWAFNGAAPGPVLRLQQGRPVTLRFDNALPQASTVHWHGLRIANAMDGVAGMTQAPVLAGSSFDYTFTPPDAGTYWYHPHQTSYEQVARGLFGALIVDEPNPPQVDRDLPLVINDWRLGTDGAVTGKFGTRHDQAHAGRLGNVMTVNGQVEPAIAVYRNERLRLRLINTATARVMSLGLEGVRSMLIAIDGQPVPPATDTYGGTLVMGPGNRADFIFDVTGEPGTVYQLVDTRSPGPATPLARFVVDADPPRRSAPLVAPMALSPNPLPMPELNRRRDVELVMTGGAANETDMSLMMGTAPIWLFNGKPGMSHDAPAAMAMPGMNAGTMDHSATSTAKPGAAGGMVMGEPLFTARRNETIALTVHNRTAWPHAMHLHGHHFRLASRSPGRLQPWWWDTILLEPRETATLAFAADNPGRWMIHCHMLDHQAAGMTTWFEVG